MIPVVCALIENSQGELLLCQRPEGKAQAGMWEFPGGKVDAGEAENLALQRELLEELGCMTLVGDALTPVVHHYDGFSIRLIPFLCKCLGEPVALEHQKIVWVRPARVKDYQLAPADVPILEEFLSFKDYC
ncbi:(deoxy)nucleoside triphosphate pyrophosphohydrolase [Rubritalea sp.]|uniref:(deoxy)nucleoside triphosphate pyrophosphohydrolase n=1 Tax=Rubritalea sp. TaxID=2109375 RepID=UPI003EF7F200